MHDRELAELTNDATNRPLEALGRIRRPYPKQQKAAGKSPDKVKVDLSDGATHQKLYNQYAQGVEASSPVNKTLAVARNAARDGQSMEDITKILHHDPKAQEFGDKSGQFIKTVSEAAVRKNQAEKSTAGLSRQSQKSPTMER